MSLCKECGLEVEWKRESGSGRWQCHNAGTDTDHWDLCSKTRAARIKATGIPFKAKRGKEKVTGYKTPFKRSGEQLTRAEHRPIRGRNYNPTGDCIGCCVPWEICTFPCPDAITH